MEWYLEVLKKYAVFSGRARRKEYWMFWLINFFVGILIALIEVFAGTWGILGAIYSLFIFIPWLAVTVRRLHDTNRSGWWMLISLVPLVGWIFFLIFMIQDSIPGTNIYGPNPKEYHTDNPRTIPKEMKKCPQCAEFVKREARICPHCGYEFYPKPKRLKKRLTNLKKRKRTNP